MNISSKRMVIGVSTAINMECVESVCVYNENELNKANRMNTIFFKWLLLCNLQHYRTYNIGPYCATLRMWDIVIQFTKHFMRFQLFCSLDFGTSSTYTDKLYNCKYIFEMGFYIVRILLQSIYGLVLCIVYQIYICILFY